VSKKTNISIYEIPRVSLVPLPDPTDDLTNQTNQNLDKQDTDIVSKQIKTPFISKIVTLLNNKKETIKTTLMPFIINLLLEFGTTAAQDVLNRNKPQFQICPSSSNIDKTIKKRNKLVKQINNLYKSVTILSKTLQITETQSKALGVGINAIYLLPIPAGGIQLLGIPSLTVGQIELVGDLIDVLKSQLKGNNIEIDALTITLASFGVLLGTIVQMLNQLDTLLAQCAEDQNMDLEQLNNEINSLSNATVTATQSENNVYKGFTLEVKINEKNTSKYIQRFAQASNKQGVPVLKTEPSFASDPAVLIDQLKFIIDSNPNITAE
jgi:cell division protein FtsB